MKSSSLLRLILYGFGDKGSYIFRTLCALFLRVSLETILLLIMMFFSITGFTLMPLSNKIDKNLNIFTKPPTINKLYPLIIKGTKMLFFCKKVRFYRIFKNME